MVRHVVLLTFTDAATDAEIDGIATALRTLPDQIPELRHYVVGVDLGLAEDNEEAEPGLRCIAVPVFDRFGKVVAALSISFPTMRCEADTPERYIALLKAASQSISARLGWRPAD